MDSGADRRRHTRHPLRPGLAVELRLAGEGEHSAVMLTRGVVTDISISGVKCSLDVSVPVGTRVDILFRELPGQAFTPGPKDGRVVRSETLDGVPSAVAIVFETPLDSLEIEGAGEDERQPARNTRLAG